MRLGLEACLGLPSKLLSRGRSAGSRWRACGCRPHPLWVLDEPFVALDAESTENLRQLLIAHPDRGGLLVLTTHQEIDVAPERMERIRLDA